MKEGVTHLHLVEMANRLVGFDAKLKVFENEGKVKEWVDDTFKLNGVENCNEHLVRDVTRTIYSWNNNRKRKW